MENAEKDLCHAVDEEWLLLLLMMINLTVILPASFHDADTTFRIHLSLCEISCEDRDMNICECSLYRLKSS